MMELRSLQSPSVSNIPRNGLIQLQLACAHTTNLSNYTKRHHPITRKLRLFDRRAVQASGATKFNSEAVEAVPKGANLKDEDLIFVAGATGRVGSRTVRELLKLGFKVRAGVRSVERAESLVQSVKQMKLDQEAQAIENLEIVACDLEKPDQIEPALGNASVVICCIGASEKEVFDITGPYRIDYQATKNLIDAATGAKVNHFILVTSLGTNKFGFPAAILNLFWGVLIWKRKAEEALLASGLPYTIVRPGGMERPTDSYKETHNITLSLEDTLFGGQVSNLQVAELMAIMAKNRSLSYCKVVEVIAETTAPLTPTEELLAKIPSQRPYIYPITESAAADGPGPGVSGSVTSESPSPSIEKEIVQTKATATRPLSPYTAYDDLKPPTSPSPSAPSTSPLGVKPLATAITGNSTPQAPDAEKGGNTQPQAEQKLQPLSPYTMYEDMKPPASPSPSPRK